MSRSVTPRSLRVRTCLAGWARDGKDLFALVRDRHDDPAWRASAAEQILLRKNYEALGSWRREDRPMALDSLGFASQLMFTTVFLGLLNLEHGDDLKMTHAVGAGSIAR